MSDREKLIRFILDNPDLIDRLEAIALWIETQLPDRQNTLEYAG